jgi:uncharacterized membrane protein
MKLLVFVFAIGLHLANSYFQGPLSIAMNLIAVFVLPGFLLSSHLGRGLTYAARTLYILLVSISITYFVAFASNMVAAVFDEKLSGQFAELLTQLVLVTLVMLPSKNVPKLRDLRLPVFHFGKAVYVLSLVLMPIAAIGSALRLNQVDDPSWSIAVVCAVVVIAFILLTVSRLWFPEFTIYVIALTLVLLGSVRGDFLSGTDMSTELYLANMVGLNGYWLPSLSPDAYNSALSATILPNYLGNLFQTDNATIFRFLFPILYALVPVLIYSLLERHRSKVFGVVGALLFVAQPAFVVWSPVPTRQMVAILFFAALLYVVFDGRFTRGQRESLGFAFGVLMIFSHYSTSYLSLPVLIVGTILAFTLRMLRIDWLHSSGQPRSRPIDGGLIGQIRRFRSNARLAGLDQTPIMSWRTLAGLTVFAMIWFGPVTHVGDNLATTIERSASEITSGHWNLLGTSGYASGTSLAYQLGLSQEVRDRESVFKFYRFEVFENAELNKLDPIEAQTWRNNPLAEPLIPPVIDSTPIGSQIATVEKVLKNLLRIFLFIGFLVLVVSMFRRRLDSLGAYALAACSALVMVIVIPGASIQYDVGRTTQQMLPLLGFAIISGAAALVSTLSLKRVKPESSQLVLGSLLICLLVSSTGLVNKFTGATSPTMMLSNSGEMFEQIYVHSEELAAAQWLESHRAPDAIIQSGYFGGTRLPLVGLERPLLRHVFSWSVDKSAYLFRGNQEVKEDAALTYFTGEYFKHKYPTDAIEKYKNMVYTNGLSEIYK